MIRAIFYSSALILCLCVSYWAATPGASETPRAGNDSQLVSAVKRSQPESQGSASQPVTRPVAKGSSEERMLITQLRSSSYVEKRHAAMTIHRSYLHNRKLQSVVEKELLKGHRIRTRNKGYIDAMAWMCNVLGDSGNPKFAETLEQVSHGAMSRKVRKYAKRNYRKVR